MSCCFFSGCDCITVAIGYYSWRVHHNVRSTLFTNSHLLPIFLIDRFWLRFEYRHRNHVWWFSLFNRSRRLWAAGWNKKITSNEHGACGAYRLNWTVNGHSGKFLCSSVSVLSLTSSRRQFSMTLSQGYSVSQIRFTLIWSLEDEDERGSYRPSHCLQEKDPVSCSGI